MQIDLLAPTYKNANFCRTEFCMNKCYCPQGVVRDQKLSHCFNHLAEFGCLYCGMTDLPTDKKEVIWVEGEEIKGKKSGIKGPPALKDSGLRWYHSECYIEELCKYTDYEKNGLEKVQGDLAGVAGTIDIPA